ncbi:hypothetical protein Lal_00012093 [Lupinus albus]|uniref:Putative Blue (Type 1) copper binding protein n=1 Tax=Lupinus albus TaxID=3870 RepID=A0A6A4QCI9_LUPAL|nr:putative Blue (type 1) copper binding protein [Lupinus albus]KAF1877320.1 hypothetical protein Lal_00012093 [Lupinus albus]
MGRTLIVCLMVIMLLLGCESVYGVDHIVGGSGGWALGNDYSTWASGETFKVGDNLVFKYDSTHQVDEVDANSYKSCSSSNSIKNYNDGNSKVPLTTSGTLYFICPAPGHCAGGMKLQLNVVAATNTTTTTTTPSGGSPPTTGTTPTPATPSESKPSGAVIVSTHLIGSLFVAAIGFCFMG